MISKSKLLAAPFSIAAVRLAGATIVSLRNNISFDFRYFRYVFLSLQCQVPDQAQRHHKLGHDVCAHCMSHCGIQMSEERGKARHSRTSIFSMEYVAMLPLVAHYLHHLLLLVLLVFTSPAILAPIILLSSSSSFFYPTSLSAFSISSIAVNSISDVWESFKSDTIITSIFYFQTYGNGLRETLSIMFTM